MKQYTDHELNIIKTHYACSGVSGCQKYIPQRTEFSIRRKAMELGISLNKEGRINVSYCGAKNRRKYHINLDLFYKINSPQVAYLLGLLWADGSILTGLYSSVRINNKKSDMEDILPVFNYVGNWSFTNVSGKPHLIRVQMYDRKFHQFLVNHDYHIKSGTVPTKILSIIPDNLKSLWWRGFLDGDGHIFKSKYQYDFNFSGTYDQDWSFISSLTQHYVIFKYTTAHGKYSIAMIRGKTYSFAALSYIYATYINDEIGFTRKYNTFLHKYHHTLID